MPGEVCDWGEATSTHPATSTATISLLPPFEREREGQIQIGCSLVTDGEGTTRKVLTRIVLTRIVLTRIVLTRIVLLLENPKTSLYVRLTQPSLKTLPELLSLCSNNCSGLSGRLKAVFLKIETFRTFLEVPSPAHWGSCSVFGT